MAYVDFKVTTWERVEIADDKIDFVKEQIRSGEIQTSNDLVEAVEGSTFEGTIDEVEEQMTVEMNEGEATIEITVDTNVIFNNKEM